MDFDFLYTEKKPRRLTKKEKDKILELLFGVISPDRKIEDYLKTHWNKILKNNAKHAKLIRVKDRILYVKVRHNAVLQELLFSLDRINWFLERGTGQKIRNIKITRRDAGDGKKQNNVRILDKEKEKSNMYKENHAARNKVMLEKIFLEIKRLLEKK